MLRSPPPEGGFLHCAHLSGGPGPWGGSANDSGREATDLLEKEGSSMGGREGHRMPRTPDHLKRRDGWIKR